MVGDNNLQAPCDSFCTGSSTPRSDRKSGRLLSRMNVFKKILVSNRDAKHASSSAAAQTHMKHQMSSASLSVDDFRLVRTLGTGSFGRVFMAKKRDDPEAPPVAVKRLKKSILIRQKQVDHIINERKVLAAVRHPFLVELIATFKDDRFLYIILEYVPGGEFFTHLRKSRRFENDTARFYAAQVATIFEYLHSKNIIYRDLKPENILIARDGYLKLTDFGFAKFVEFRSYTLCGTPEYIAPEILLNKGHGKPVDWWTLGILIYEMIVGYPPFFDDEPMGIYQKILAGKIVFPRFFDRYAKALVKRLLTHDLGKRYGNLRDGAEDIKRHRWFQGLDWDDLVAKKIPAPYKPTVRSLDDTSNFEEYPESTELPPPVTGTSDPFVEW